MKKIINVVGLLGGLCLLFASCANPSNGGDSGASGGLTDVSKLAGTVWIWNEAEADNVKTEVLNPDLVKPEPTPNPGQGSGGNGEAGGNGGSGSGSGQAGGNGGSGSGSGGGSQPEQKPQPQPKPDPDKQRHSVDYLYFDNNNYAFYGNVKWTGVNGSKTYTPLYAGPYKADSSSSKRILFDFKHALKEGYDFATQESSDVWDSKGFGRKEERLTEKGLFYEKAVDVSQSKPALKFIEKNVNKNQKITYKWDKDPYGLDVTQLIGGFSKDKLCGPNFENAIYYGTICFITLNNGTIIPCDVNENSDHTLSVNYGFCSFGDNGPIKYNNNIYSDKDATYENRVYKVIINVSGNQLKIQIPPKEHYKSIYDKYDNTYKLIYDVNSNPLYLNDEDLTALKNSGLLAQQY